MTISAATVARRRLSTLAWGRSLVAAACLFALCATSWSQSPTHAPPAASTPPAAQPAADADEEPLTRSAMDAAMFYELLIADIQMGEGDYATAYQIFSRNAPKSHDERLYALALNSALLTHSGSNSLSAAQAWVKAYPQSRQANESLANIAIVMGQSSTAIQPLRDLIDQTPAPQREALIRALPRVLARMSDSVAAAKVLDQTLQPYLQSGPSQTAAQLTMAQMWAQAKDAQRALNLLQAAQAKEPGNMQVAFIAADLMAQTPEAESLITKQLAAAPKSNLVKIKYANVLYGAQRFNEAKAQLDEVLSDDPKMSLAWLMKGQVCHDLRQYALSDEALKAYLQLTPAPAEGEDNADPDSAINTPTTHNTVYLLLAESAQEQGKPDQALQWLDKLPPTTDDSNVVARRASVLTALGRKSQAQALLDALPTETPDDVQDKYRVQTQVLMDNKQWPAAYALLGQAHERFPKNTSFLYDQALLAEKLGQLDDMERLLRQVMELKPNYQHAYNALGYSLAEHKVRLDDARKWVKKALDLAPGDPLITDSMGWVEFRSGNDAEALRLVRAAYAKRAEPEIAAHLVEILWHLNRQDEALTLARQCYKLYPRNEEFLDTLKRLNIRL